MESAKERAPDLELVRDALRHLYDNNYLDKHPLVPRFFGHLYAGGFARSKAMRKLLLDAIESTRPAEGAPAQDPAWRHYRILCARYIDSLPTAEVMKRVALGHSQYHEEHRMALEGVTQFLLAREKACADGVGSLPQQWGQHMLLHKEMKEVAATETLDLVDVDELLGDVLAMVRPLAERKGLELVHQVSPCAVSMEAYVRRVILRQLIIQILGSMVRRAREGVLRVGLDREDDARIRVSLTAEHLEGDEGLDDATRELAVAVGAYLDVQPVGTSVQVLLTLPTGQGRLALLVDNDPDLEDLFRRYLVGHSWKLVAVQDADKGLKVARQLRPDAIILDVIMPKADGWDLLARLRTGERTAGIRVIVCSVLSQPELALTLGADMFMAKPVDQFTLLRALRWVSETPHTSGADLPASG